MSIRSLLILLSIPFLFACSRDDLGQAQFPDNYEAQFDTWHDNRLESLTSPTGWMRLAGMFWLENGENTFGSSDTVDIRFPEGTIPGYAGVLMLEGDQVHFQAAGDVQITHDGNPVEEKIIYNGEEALHLEYGSLEWLVIEREELIGIRLYNKDNPKVDAFTGFDRYPLSPEWYLNAKFVPAAEGATIPVVNVLGQQVDSPTPGTIEFSVGEQLYTLDALEGDDRMFIIVGDLTNRSETYQGGRYIYIDYPEEDSDYTIIDFNKLYNPPCAYSIFSTCLLPPIQNRLDLAVTAGEKRPKGWDGLEHPG